jgi:hypothetical protein
MKICVIGDEHSRGIWREITETHKDSDMFIFLGDYCDPYKSVTNEDIIGNLEDIISFKKSNLNRVILLLGNHDLHYFTSKIVRSTRFDYTIADKLEKLFIDNLNLFQNAFQINYYIFTHAGIGKEWFLERFKGDLSKNIASQLNYPEKSQGNTLYDIGYNRGGNNMYGGIFWADYDEFENNLLPGYIQIVGHNQVRDIAHIVDIDAEMYLCDCLGYSKNPLILEINERES